jgi:hypothetical protein
MTERIYVPAGAVCEKCDLPLAFIELASGKWRPCNPDGSDHWDVCRDARYAKAKAGECREKTWEDKRNVHRMVYWDGGKKPFVVLHSIKVKNQLPAVAGSGFIPIEEHLAHAAKHGYAVREVS